MIDERPVMIDIKDVKKKYVIRHNTDKPASFSGRLKLVTRKVLHPSRRYDKEDFWALKGISFQVRQGEKVGIIGKNGAGKSTLLKILSRITEPTDGRIELLGKVSAMLEVGTGFNGELTGRENIYLNGAILGMTKAEIDSKFDDIVEFSEVGRFIDTPVKRYSSGMFVRLAFAVASHLDPDILIVDEVLSVGDTKFQRKCITQMATVENVEVLDKDSCVWLYNESIHFKVTVKAHDDCEDLRFEFMFRDMTDKNLGKAESAPLGVMKSGETYEYDIVLNTQNVLAPDKYTLGIELWKIKENLYTVYDIVVDALSIEILSEDESRPEIPEIFWESNIFGNMMLPEAEVKLLSEKM